MVYLRVLVYFVSPMLGMLPGVTYDAAAQQIIVDIEAALAGVAGSALLSSLVFGIWGKK